MKVINNIANVEVNSNSGAINIHFKPVIKKEEKKLEYNEDSKGKIFWAPDFS